MAVVEWGMKRVMFAFSWICVCRPGCEAFEADGARSISYQGLIGYGNGFNLGGKTGLSL